MEAFDISRLSFTYPNEASPALDDISMSIPEGSITLIIGASGSGKSTLLRRLKTCLADSGKVEGSVLFFGRELGSVSEAEQAKRIGFVFQHPDDQIVTDKVFHELAFGPESLGWPQDKMRLAVSEMASYFGLESVYCSNVSSLSGGQKQLVNLAAAAVTHPDVLILDEPTSQLDPIAASEFLSILRKLNEELGMTVILTEHRLEEALPMADMLAVLDGGRLIAFDVPQKASKQVQDKAIFASMPTAVKIFAALGGDGDAPLTVREGRRFIKNRLSAPKEILPMEKERTSSVAAELKGCWFRYEKNAPDVLCALTLRVHEGEVFALVGGNGSGKSTTLGLVTGRLKPYRGKVTTHGRVCALPQDARELLVKDTVIAELRELCSDEADIRDMLTFLELDWLSLRHPFDLSGGEQQRLALGKVLLTKPDILLLDEPTKGMDGQMKAAFGKLLRRLAGEGRTVLMVSHDIEFCALNADRCALLFNGEAVTQCPPHEFFSGNFFYTTAAARLARGMIPGAVLGEEVIKCFQG